MSQLQEKIEQMSGQILRMTEVINKQGLAIQDQACAINSHAEAIDQTQAALQRIISWVSGELGEEAVDRLSKMLGEGKEKESAIIT